MIPYFEALGVTIYHADCRDVLPELGPVQHVITDPPYSEYVHSKSRRGGASAPPLNGRGERVQASFCRTKEFGFQALGPELRKFAAREFGRLCERWCLVFSDVESTWLWRYDLIEAGLEYVRTGAWNKLGGTPQFTGDRPGQGFETITISHPPGKKRWNGGGSLASWAHAIALNRGSGQQRVHPTEKPMGLIRELVELFTDPGDLILDPFAGSGTTAVAARALGRRCILVEAEEQWCEWAAARMGAATPDQKIQLDEERIAVQTGLKW